MPTRLLKLLACIFALCVALPTQAADLQQDKDYRVIEPPVAVEAKGKIEVIEFFWYGCPHCFDFDPVVAEWVKRLPADVSFRRKPAVFPNNKWVPMARLYFTLEAMGLTEKLHTEVFNAVHLDRMRMDEEKTMMVWIAGRGVDARKFTEVWNSPAIQSKVQDVKELTVKAGVDGVPALMVQGRYIAKSKGNYGDLVKVGDQLIERARVDARRK
jgi:thiol:disulfide interchange protein DsbA